MANETGRTVTISADYFAELYAAKKDKDQYAEAVLNIVKERDELKAKLDAARDASNDFESRLAAAERCIEDINRKFWRWNTGDVNGDSFSNKVYTIIRAWREKREAK